MRKIEYKEGDIVGNYIYLFDVDSSSSRKAIFRCDNCKEEFESTIYYVISGKKKCQCSSFKHIKRKNYDQHGMSKTRIYSIWRSIKKRCYNKQAKEYQWYGAKGIQMCERWKNSFLEFLKDMGEDPSPQHTIDREDTSGNYEPENCRWATQKEQANNTSKNVHIEYNGEVKTLKQWSEFYDMNITTFSKRYYKGMTFEEIISTPVKEQIKRVDLSTIIVEIEGLTKSAKEWSELLGIAEHQVKMRLSRGKTMKEALTKKLRKPRRKSENE